MVEFCSSVIEEEKIERGKKAQGLAQLYFFQLFYFFLKTIEKKSTLKMKMYLNKKNYGL